MKIAYYKTIIYQINEREIINMELHCNFPIILLIKYLNIDLSDNPHKDLPQCSYIFRAINVIINVFLLVFDILLYFRVYFFSFRVSLFPVSLISARSSIKSEGFMSKDVSHHSTNTTEKLTSSKETFNTGINQITID